jgi:hypothetical protein
VTTLASVGVGVFGGSLRRVGRGWGAVLLGGQALEALDDAGHALPALRAIRALRTIMPSSS